MIRIKSSIFKRVRREIESMLITLPGDTQERMKTYGEQTVADVLHKATANIRKTAVSIHPSRASLLETQLLGLIFTALLLYQKIQEEKKEPVL